MAKNYLDELGLSKFWNDKIKPLIYRKATLQNDLVVKNPRVTVDDDVKQHTFTAGSNIEEVLNYLYRNVIAEANPDKPVVYPTVTTKCTPDVSEAELNSVVSYTVQKNSFSAGKIGTCVAPWEEEPHQSSIASGSTEKTEEFKIYSGSTNVPGECTDEPEMADGKVIGDITVSVVGKNPAGVYYCATTGYNGSTAESKTSYGNKANVSGVSSFIAGTTVKSACVTCDVTGYKPAFGNIKLSESTAADINISNLGNNINAAESTEFWYGPVDTTSTNTATFHIYIPSERSMSGLEWYDAQTQSWVDMISDVETSSEKFYATLPAGNDSSKFPDKGLTEGVEYKEIHVIDGQAWGARKYRITLA